HPHPERSQGGVCEAAVAGRIPSHRLVCPDGLRNQAILLFAPCGWGFECYGDVTPIETAPIASGLPTTRGIIVWRLELKCRSTAPSTFCAFNQALGSDLAGTCSCGQFVVSMEGEAYYVRTGGPNRKFWLDLADDTGFAQRRRTTAMHPTAAAEQVNFSEVEVTMLNEGTIAAFRASLRGGVIEPGDPSYDAARKVYNGMIDRRPRLIARCADVADVMTAVKFGREQKLLVAIRGGGHNAGGLGVCDDGLVIDLSPMNYVRVD